MYLLHSAWNKQVGLVLDGEQEKVFASHGIIMAFQNH